MKKSIIILTMAMLISITLTGCEFQEIDNPDTESEPEIQIATIATQTEHAAPKPAPTTETQALSETIQTVPEEVTESDTDANSNFICYTDSDFEKAIFVALLDGLCVNTIPDCYIMADSDSDNYSEFMIAMPTSETTSQNIVLESPATAGIYYYDATGVSNDFFVIDSEQNKVLLNENTRSELKTEMPEFQNPETEELEQIQETENNAPIISREYFEWQGNHWETVSILYGNHCYWNNTNVSTGEFLTHAENTPKISPTEDIFNIYLAGDIQKITNAFYEYLAKYYKQLEKPVSADINGDGIPEQFLFVQNLSKNWISNIHNLYESDGELDITGLDAMHTTCFVLDYVENYVRIRSENFDRKYIFAESGGMLFAYDDTNSIQTIQYSDRNAVLGEHFMSVMWG
ncbi:MAG: hypothetical protein K2J88_05860 [Oscillospiraceae bacterium]|nr:hypothetical protein [Oscillospiraceae bacterium]